MCSLNTVISVWQVVKQPEYLLLNDMYLNGCMDLWMMHEHIVSAKDSLEFLVRWLDRFPRYKTRDVFLTGESYAGHYVPQLAREILAYNAKSSHPIHLKGIMVTSSPPSPFGPIVRSFHFFHVRFWTYLHHAILIMNKVCIMNNAMRNKVECQDWMLNKVSECIAGWECCDRQLLR